MKEKELQKYIKDDPNLARKITYEEFQNSIIPCEDLDDGVKEAYEEYRQFTENDK